MMRRDAHLAAVISGLLFSLIGGGVENVHAQVTPPVAAAPIRSDSTPLVSVFVDCRSVDLRQPGIRAALLAPPVRRIIVPLLVDGETPFTPRRGAFRQMALYEGGAVDPIEILIRDAKARGVAVYGAMNLLRWAPPSNRTDIDPFKDRPELAERTLDLSTGSPLLGKYASPFHAGVWEALEGVVQEATTRYPNLDGLLLDLSLPIANYYGYGSATRAACIRAVHLDPIDIEIAPPEQRTELAGTLATFRMQESTARMSAFCATVHKAAPPWRIVLVGDPALYKQGQRERNRSLNDWLTWLTFPGVDEVALTIREAAGTEATGATDTFAAAAALPTKSPRQMSALLELHSGKKTFDPAQEGKALVSQGLRRPILVLRTAEDVDRLSRFWAAWPAVEAK